MRGSIGGYLTVGTGTFGFGFDQNGRDVSGISWGNKYVHIGSNPDVDGWGWSMPLGPASIGEDYTASGTFGTFSVGSPFLGLAFSVAKDNPTTNMEAHGNIRYEKFDKDGNLIGYTVFEAIGSSEMGRNWLISFVDLSGRDLAKPRIVPMDVQTSLVLGSGFAVSRCFPAHTRIQTSRTTSTAISALRVGDVVLAFDARADKGRGALVPRRVTRLYRNTTTDWFRLRWHDGTAREVITTPGHHFLDELGGFPTIAEMVKDGRATVVLASGEVNGVRAARSHSSAETAHLVERARVGLRGAEAVLGYGAIGVMGRGRRMRAGCVHMRTVWKLTESQRSVNFRSSNVKETVSAPFPVGR